MGRMYTGVFEGVAVTVIQDLFELTVPATVAVILHRVRITNDAGETSEQLPVRLRRGVGATSGSGGSTPTPAKHVTGDAASGCTLEANNTTVMSAGTITTVGRAGENIVGSFYRYEPTPEERIVLAPSERLVVHLPTAPGASLTLSGEITFEEIG